MAEKDLIPMNYDALKEAGIFGSNAQNLRSWMLMIFRGGMDKNGETYAELKASCESAINDCRTNLDNLQQFLDDLNPPTH